MCEMKSSGHDVRGHDSEIIYYIAVSFTGEMVVAIFITK